MRVIKPLALGMLSRPVEFHRRYMHCLIDYGRARAGRSGWAALEP